MCPTKYDSELLETMVNSPKPLIAAVNGPAIGILPLEAGSHVKALELQVWD